MAMRERHQVDPFHGAAGRGVLHAAVAIAQGARRNAQPMRRNRHQLVAHLAGRVVDGAAQHDRHAAADGAVAGQAFQRCRPYNANAVGIDLQRLAGDGRGQRLVALAGRGGVNGDRDRAQRIDHDAAGFHPGRGGVLGVEQRLEGRVAAAGLQAARHADAGQQARSAQPVALGDQRFPVGVIERLLHHRVVVAAVVGAAAGDQVGELVGADEIAPAHLQPVEAQRLGDAVDAGLDGVVGGRLAEAAHRLLRRLVGRHGDGVIGDRADAVGADDGADRLAELQRRAARVGADVVERAHAHGMHEARAVECQLDVEHALRPVHVAAAHVLQPVLDQLHGPRQPAREIAREHRMLDAALDAVAAADVHVLMHAHAVERHAQGARDLVGELGHLDRGPHVQHLAPRVPARHHAEGLDRHGGAAAPLHAIGQLVRRRGEGLVDVAPHEALVEQHVGAVVGMHRRAVRPVGGLAVEQERAAARSRCGSSRARPRQARGCRPPRRRPTRRHSARGRRPADSASPAAHRRRSAAHRWRLPAHARRPPDARPAWPSASAASMPTMRAQA